MTWRVLRRTVATAAGRAVADRGGLLFSGLFYLMVTAVLAALWTAAAGDAAIAGYPALALTWYVATSEAATIPLNFRLIETIGDDIGSGAVATEMLRPASVVGTRIATEFGAMLPKLGICATIGVVFVATIYGAPPSVLALTVALPALALGLLINIVAQHAFASAAFWVEDAKGTWFLYQKLVFVLGGMLLPIEVLPDALEAVARWLPMVAMAYAPARLASGHLDLQLIVIQLFWLGVMLAVAVRAFESGERRLQAVGG